MSLDNVDYLFIFMMGTFALIITALGMYQGLLLLGLIPITVLLRHANVKTERSEGAEGAIKK